MCSKCHEMNVKLNAIMSSSIYQDLSQAVCVGLCAWDSFFELVVLGEGHDGVYKAPTKEEGRKQRLQGKRERADQVIDLRCER